MVFENFLPGADRSGSVMHHIVKRTSLCKWLLACLLSTLSLHALAEIPADRQASLRHFLKQDCGSCHGMTMKGGLGPALTVEAIGQKPKEMILAAILDGRPGTPMPPFRGMLTEEEARWLVELLYQGEI